MSKNKDEEIKLYLNAITTRDPSKRQIKPVDKDAFQLFDDLESESDEDFVVGSDELSDDQQIGSDEINSSTSEEIENEGEEDEEESSISDSPKVLKSCTKIEDKIEKETDKYSDVKITSKTKIENVLICMMCLLDSSFCDNEIVECDGCGIVVHEDCYKISDSVFLTCDSSETSTDPWFCDACLNKVREPRCELCPVEGGVFKRTENNRWVHLLCALYTPGVAFNDIENLCEITLSELPLKEWSARECSLCSNPFYAKTGVCISCDAGLCKNFFHVLCAQKEGLLSEPNNEENSDDPYFANCRQHTDTDIARRRKKNWNAAINRQKLRLDEWLSSTHYDDSRLIRKRELFSELYMRSLDQAPMPFVPLTKVPCFLETNPVAVHLFRKKAINLRLPQDVLHSQTSGGPDYKSSVGSGVPVFGPDFISYFLDREKRIDQTTSEIVQLEGLQRELQISEQNTSHQFNKTVAKKDAASKEHQEKLEQLLAKIDLIQRLTKTRELADLLTSLLDRLEPTVTFLNGFDEIACSNGLDYRDNGSGTQSSIGGNGGSSRPAPTTAAVGAAGTGTSESVINECYQCKSVSDQHLLIDCDKCRKFIHIGCLEPPLTRMPRKTKLYGWQCSHCTAGRQEEDQQAKNVDVNCPRQLRRSKDIPSGFGADSAASGLMRDVPTMRAALRRRVSQRTFQQSTNTSDQDKDSVIPDPVPPKSKSRGRPRKSDSRASQEIDLTKSPLPNVTDTEQPVLKVEDCETKPPESEPPADIEIEIKDASNTHNDDVVYIGVSENPLPKYRKSDRARKRPLTLVDEFENNETNKLSEDADVESKRCDDSESSKPLQAQRKSDRPRKRPLTLLDEYEIAVALKKPHHLQVPRHQRKKSSLTMKEESIANQLVVTLTLDESISALSAKAQLSESDIESPGPCQLVTPQQQQMQLPLRPAKQLITFYPSSETSASSSKHSAESERVRIGSVSKKQSGTVKDAASGSQKNWEKKSILIKCHADQDEDHDPVR